MGKLVSIVGGSGSGKTTLARMICQAGAYTPYLEDLRIRPFQASFMKERTGYGLANQVDFLLYRAEQEMAIRQSGGVGVQDGGLDLDFHVFSRLFLENAYLNEDEFGLVQRMYCLLRGLLPPPDCIIRLNVPLDVLAARRNARRRELDIAANTDLERIDRLLQDWFSQNPPASPVLEVDYEPGDIAFINSIPWIIEFIRTHI